jgi:m7GpppX diphosphatase
MIKKILESKVYSFTPNDNWIDKIIINDPISDNDVFESYNAKIEAEGKLIICKDKSKLKVFCKKIIRETYEEYLDFISKYDFSNDKWMYNILDGVSEQNDIIYQDDKIIIIPDYKWNKKDKDKLHILAIPKDKNLKSIRSLDFTHIDLLKHCQIKTCEIIKQLYDIDSDILKMYFHYAPSTWHLHIHFVNLNNFDAASSIEYCHELSSVIFNLGIYSDYYKNTLNKRI